MAGQNSKRGGRSWKMERASVTRQSNNRSKSNKYSKSDGGDKPMPGSRSRVWVGGYTRADGTKVEGYYRELGNTNSR